ncbi:MAG: type VI secretion system baseplate subunit TssG [Ferruginibacter sp.]
MEDFIEHISNVVSELPYDLRAEVVIADLIQRGVIADDMIVSPIGLFKRRFSRDIAHISIKETDSGQKYTRVEINREGIYDSIPQALSHAAKLSKTGGLKSPKEMVDEVNQVRKEKEAARKFFLPIENEFYHQRIQLETEEQNILKGYLDSSIGTALMNKFWQLPEILDTRQKATFIYLIPTIHRAVGNLGLTKLCYEAVLNIEVNFQINKALEQTVSNQFELGAGKLKLGMNFVCGSKFYNHSSCVEIIVRPLNEIQLSEYLPGEKGTGIIEFLNGYYLPFDLETKLKIDSDLKNKEFVLSAVDSNLRLGHNVFI